MLKILGRDTSSNVMKVLWACAELGIEFEREDIGGKFGGNDTADFRALNPNGLVPVIVDDGFVNWESNSCVRYLAAKHDFGGIYPEDLAVRADLDLGGLSLNSLELMTGASESRIDVSAPNPLRMRRARLDVGAADFEARRLGNLNAEELELNAGVGSVVLDLSGELAQDMDVSVNIGLGSLELRIPEGVGVRIEKESFLASLDTDGMVKRGDAYYSSNWDDADRRIEIDVHTAFGSVDVVWLR